MKETQDDDGEGLPTPDRKKKERGNRTKAKPREKVSRGKLSQEIEN